MPYPPREVRPLNFIRPYYRGMMVVHNPSIRPCFLGGVALGTSTLSKMEITEPKVGKEQKVDPMSKNPA